MARVINTVISAEKRFVLIKNSRIDFKRKYGLFFFLLKLISYNLSSTLFTIHEGVEAPADTMTCLTSVKSAATSSSSVSI